jgi:hypothetical protein
LLTTTRVVPLLSVKIFTSRRVAFKQAAREHGIKIHRLVFTGMS